MELLATVQVGLETEFRAKVLDFSEWSWSGNSKRKAILEGNTKE